MYKYILKQIYALLPVLVFITCCAGQNTPTTYSKEVESQIKQVENNLAGRVKIEGEQWNITDRMNYFKFYGVSIAVIQDFKVVWAKGYGWADISEKRPVTENTLFQVASVSKSINSMGVLKLVQDKKLDLHTDINEYLTSWKFPYDTVSNGKKNYTAPSFDAYRRCFRKCARICRTGYHPYIGTNFDGRSIAFPVRVFDRRTRPLHRGTRYKFSIFQQRDWYHTIDGK